MRAAKRNKIWETRINGGQARKKKQETNMGSKNWWEPEKKEEASNKMWGARIGDADKREK